MLKLRAQNLFEVHKAERRARILAAARKLIARHSVDGLTLRELAAASGVSVPTVYNLIGSKQALLSMLLKESFARVAARLEAARGGGMVERALALCEAGWIEMLAEPSYFRGLVRAFLISEESAPARRENDSLNVELMTGILAAGQSAGELAGWADPRALATTLYSFYLSTMLRWAGGELDDAQLPTTVSCGLGFILLGVARGEAARKLERLARAHQQNSHSPATTVAIAVARKTKKGARR